jgi:hypothetical protein
MGFRSARRTERGASTDTGGGGSTRQASTAGGDQSTGVGWIYDIGHGEDRYGMTIRDTETLQRLQHHESTFGAKVHDWISEGMPTDIMGKTRDMEAFRQRQADRPPEVPTNIERRNRRSVQRSEQATAETAPAGDAGVPEPVRDVISSTGRSLDASIQRAMEDRMGDSLGDVRIHTGPQAATACESINARAFTVGDHIAFNSGEYDPGSPEGQHVLAHELAHVRQQTSGAVSMLPQEDMELEIDPDPALEREAEETAQSVMAGGELGIQRLADTEVHIQRAGLGSIARSDTSTAGGRPEQAPQPTHLEEPDFEIDVDEIAADPEVLAAEVQQIKANQQMVMKTLTDAKPGAPSDFDPAQTAVKGLAGSLANAGTGAMIGTLVGGPVGTAVGAGIGAVGGMTSDLVKQGVGYSADRLSGSEAQHLEQMYSEMTRMYEELKEGSEHAEALVGRSRRD